MQNKFLKDNMNIALEIENTIRKNMIYQLLMQKT